MASLLELLVSCPKIELPSAVSKERHMRPRWRAMPTVTKQTFEAEAYDPLSPAVSLGRSGDGDWKPKHKTKDICRSTKEGGPRRGARETCTIEGASERKSWKNIKSGAAPPLSNSQVE